MPEENKNLETQEKKPAKSWLFRIGLGLIVLGGGLIGLGMWALSQPCEGDLCYLSGFFFVLLGPLVFLFSLGIVLILVHYFLRLRKREGKIALLVKIIIIFLLLYIIYSFFSALYSFVYSLRQLQP
jgi:hypothetical protein